MADKPPVWCNKCRIAHAGKCPERKAFTRKRNTQKNGRGGRAWRRTRECVFNRDRFLCQICLRAGRYTAVELNGANHGICDHIKPLAECGSNSVDNLQTICQACDKKKTHEESQRARNTGGGKSSG